MSLVTVKDFGIALGISGGTIRSKINRKQLLRNKNNLIDTENPLNYKYVLEVNGGDFEVFTEYDKSTTNRTKVERKVNNTIKKDTFVSKPKTIKPKTVSKSQKTKNTETSDSKGSVNIAPTVETDKLVSEKKVYSEQKATPEERKRIREEVLSRKMLLDYDLRQRKANAEVKEREAELRKMQLEKLAGNTLPLDLTKQILHINCQAILIQFLAAVENMVSITVEELGGDRSDNVRITKELKTVFKKTVENCEANSNREIAIAVEEYSEVRSRGERK